MPEAAIALYLIFGIPLAAFVLLETSKSWFPMLERLWKRYNG